MLDTQCFSEFLQKSSNQLQGLYSLNLASTFQNTAKENEQRRCKQETEMKMGIKLFLGLK